MQQSNGTTVGYTACMPGAVTCHQFKTVRCTARVLELAVGTQLQFRDCDLYCFLSSVDPAPAVASGKGHKLVQCSQLSSVVEATLHVAKGRIAGLINKMVEASGTSPATQAVLALFGAYAGASNSSNCPAACTACMFLIMLLPLCRHQCCCTGSVYGFAVV
jgi:hypothetical protein